MEFINHLDPYDGQQCDNRQRSVESKKKRLAGDFKNHNRHSPELLDRQQYLNGSDSSDGFVLRTTGMAGNRLRIERSGGNGRKGATLPKGDRSVVSSILLGGDSITTEPSNRDEGLKEFAKVYRNELKSKYKHDDRHKRHFFIDDY